MKSSISFLFLILSLLACRKEVKGPTIVYGKVLEQGTNKPVPNALVKLVNANGNFHPNFEVIHDSTRTDSTGYYEIEIDKAFSEDIMVYAKAEKYFNHQDNDGVEVPKSNVIKNQNQNKTITLVPYAYLAFAAKPEVNFPIYVNSIPGFDYHEGFGFFLDNQNPIIRRTFGNQEVEINFFRMDVTPTIHSEVTVLTSSTDTIFVELGF